jgi:hypothetical protein
MIRPWFLLVLALSPLFYSNSAIAQSCSDFSETFGPPPIHSWRNSGGKWASSNGRLTVSNIAADTLAYAETSFTASDFFRMDVDVNLDAPSGNGSVGIYPFTSGDLLVGVGDSTLDGIGALVFGSGNSYLLGWDVIKGEWFQSEPYQFSGTVTSVGLRYSSTEIVLRINEADTPLRVTGQFGMVPSLLDTLWLMAQGASTTTAWFDNVCVGPVQQSTPAGDAASRFIFPYYQAVGGSFTGFAISNYSSQPAQLNFKGYSSDGNLLPFPGNPRSLNLAAGQQSALLGNEIFQVQGTTIQQGWVELTSDTEDLGSFFQVGEAERLDGSVSLTEVSRQLYFTRVYEGTRSFRNQDAATFVSLVNPNNSPVKVELSLRGSGSDRTLTRTLPAKGCLYGTLSQIFGTSLTIKQGFLAAHVTEGDGLAGYALLQAPQARTWIGLNAAAPNLTSQLFSAQLASVPGLFTSVKLVNTGSQSRSVTLSAVSETGTNLAAPVSFTLGAGQVYERDAGEIFGWSAGLSKIGSLRVEADGPDVVGDVVFGDSAGLSLAAALPLQTRLFTEGIFSQVANALGLYTGLAFYNPGDASAQISIDVFRENGTRSGSKTISLASGRRLSQLLTEYLPATAGQIKGYVRVQSSQPIVAQQLFGASNLLSAVPPTMALRSVAGPGGSYVQMADQSEQRGASVSLQSDSIGNLTESGELAVSSAVRISLGSLEPLQGAGFFKISIPISASGFDPAKLTAKVRLSTGVVLPLSGTYNAGRKAYEIEVPTLVDGWVLGVVESNSISLVPVGGGGEVSPMGEVSPEGWLTPVDWETCEFHPIRHTNTVTDATIREDYLPTMWKACQSMSWAGFRSPKLWVASGWNDEALDPPGRIVHITQGAKSFFQGSWLEESAGFSEVDRTEEEMIALGQMYMDLGQLATYQQDYGVSFGNIFAHELFHAVQFGYDFRRGAVKTGDEWTTSYKGYTEGTAAPLGQTFQKGNGAIAGPNIWVRELGDGEATPLDEPIDNNRSNYYRKQDFWVWVARKYGNNSWAYTNQLFEELGMATYGQFNKTLNQYLALYRQGADKAFRSLFGKGFAEIYSEFALDRAYEHSAFALHRDSERTGWKKNKLANSLFGASGLKEIKPTSEKLEERQAVFSNVQALSTYAVRLEVSDEDRDAGVMVLNFLVSGVAVANGGIQIYVFREDLNSVMQPGGKLRVTKVDDPVEVPLNKDTKSLTLLIVNTDLQTRSASVTVSTAKKFELKFYPSPWDEPYGFTPVYAVSFAADGSPCINAEFTVFDADKEMPLGVYILFRYPNGDLIFDLDREEIYRPEDGNFLDGGRTWQTTYGICFGFTEGESSWVDQPRGDYTVDVQDQDHKPLISGKYQLY